MTLPKPWAGRARSMAQKSSLTSRVRMSSPYRRLQRSTAPGSPKKGEWQCRQQTRRPCSSRTLAARMLSRPPENSTTTSTGRWSASTMPGAAGVWKSEGVFIMARLLRESGGRRQEPGPDFRSRGIGFFVLSRRCGPHAGQGTLLRRRARAASRTTALLSPRMGAPSDGAGRRRCAVRACTAPGTRSGIRGAGSRDGPAPPAARRPFCP